VQLVVGAQGEEQQAGEDNGDQHSE
jgi:hypothetical protein